MKRKILISVLAFVGIVSSAFGFAACKNDKTDSDYGLSAYEIYLKYTKDDPVLSEEEWLASLKGETGATGDKGDCGDGFWESNPQGLAFYPQDDDTFAVGIGSAIRLSEIVIPDKYLDKNVTAIAENGFNGGIYLKELKLPDSIKEVADHAFDGCVSLEKIHYGKNVVTPNDVISVNGVSTWKADGLVVGNDVFANSSFMTVDFEDSHDNDTFVDLYINSWIKDSTLRFSAALNTVTDLVAEHSLNYSSVKTHYTVDFKTYGLFKNIKVELVKSENAKIAIADVPAVAVTADEYNFAPLTASYPVLVFTLKLHEISDNGNIPTFVCMDRNNQYDWNNLPYNAQVMPFAKRSSTTSNAAFHPLRDGLSAYIKELYEINPNSKFNLYIGDNYGEVVLQMFVANRIPEENWSAVMFSDGAGTAGILSDTYGVDNPTAKYNEMKANWEEIKKFVYDSGTFDIQAVSAKVKYIGASNVFQLLERYAYVMTKEESNISWIVNRLRATENLTAINQKDPTFVNGILATVQQVYTNNLLSALTAEQAENFKALYKFNSDMFAEAEKQEKDVIMILGTSWDAEDGNLYDNVKMLVELYGTKDYVYYYKGHPGYPTSQYTGRQAYFAALADEGYEIYELDNAIAAEIILFFKPDVYMAGYNTSTFDSVEGADKALLLFGSKADMQTQTYAKYFDVFASVLTDKSAYNGISFNDSDKYYLIEYNNTPEYASQVANYNKHEIAIYNASDKTIKYYKLSSGTYTEVKEDGSAI